MGNVLFLQIPPAMLARSNIFHYLCGINETKDMKRRNALWMAALAMVLVGCQQQKFTPSKHAPVGDTYIQPYLPAAVLKGATPENGYTPTEPFTVEMQTSVNAHSDLKISGKGRVVYLYVLGDGWDTKKRQVEVLLPPGDDALHKVFNCPSLYTQCKTIEGEWPGLK